MGHTVLPRAAAVAAPSPRTLALPTAFGVKVRPFEP